MSEMPRLQLDGKIPDIALMHVTAYDRERGDAWHISTRMTAASAGPLKIHPSGTLWSKKRAV